MSKLKEPKLPEHEKLQKPVKDVTRVADLSQRMGGFIEWTQMQGVHFMVWQEGNDEPAHIKREPYERDGTKVRSPLLDHEDYIENPDYVPEGWRPYNRNIQQMLADYFGVDYDELMREKDAILEYIREKQARSERARKGWATRRARTA